MKQTLKRIFTLQDCHQLKLWCVMRHCWCLVFLVTFITNGLAREAGRGMTVGKDKIRIACVGNSITYGGGLKDKAHESYPAVLQQKLGEHYEVGNFGQNGATLLSKGPHPYVETDAFKKALAFRPDVVIIDLGINDTGLKVWPNYKDDFTADYLALIERFRGLDSRPDVWICSMTPYFNQSKRFKAALRDWYWEVQENIALVAEAAGTGLIDLHAPLYTKPHLFSDAVHPDRDGAKVIAETIYGVISGDYGGLSVAEIFGSHMVLQRNVPVPVWGKTNSQQDVHVSFGNVTMNTTADLNGDWKVEFPARGAGGPFDMRIRSGKEKIFFEDILVGEVWMCSGQSNMTFRLSEAETGGTDVSAAKYPQIRLFNMKTADSTIREEWGPEVLGRINNLEYDGGVWERCAPGSAADFSAVAYYFGKKLHEELNIPVGLVHNSKGGSPAEAWVDRRTLEFDPLLADLFHDWKNNPMIALFCRERGIHNTRQAPNPLQRHPYEPSYLFDACMKPWIGFPLKGIIWYQGEANAHNAELHDLIFSSLIKSWRGHWGEGLPVYFAQLSSFQSPSWPHFRNRQRLLSEDIPGTGMAVTSDVGDRDDIHPKRKKEVGERLALWALAKDYGFKVDYSGPVVTSVTSDKNYVRLDFSHATGLATSNGAPPRSFEVAGKDKVFRSTEATIEGQTIVLRAENPSWTKYVRYGWTPVSAGNVVNGAGLPASTFLVEVTNEPH